MLVNMARVYGYSLAAMAMPDPLPPLPDMPDYRTLEGQPAILSYEMSLVLSDALDLLDSAADAIGEEPNFFPNFYDSPQREMTESAADLAAECREEFNFTIHDQVHAQSALEVFRFLRTEIENQGIFVFLFKMPLEDCRGFCWIDNDIPPAIIINSSEPTNEAMIFTLLHEYCHLLLRLPGVSGGAPQNQTERFCNQFTANFLMPEGALQAARQMPAAPLDWEIDDVREIAETLKVSQQALSLRLEETGHAPDGFYVHWLQGAEARGFPGRGDFIPHTTYEYKRVRALGPGYSDLIMHGLGAGNLSRLDVYRATKVKPENFDSLRTEINNMKRDRVIGA